MIWLKLKYIFMIFIFEDEKYLYNNFLLSPMPVICQAMNEFRKDVRKNVQLSDSINKFVIYYKKEHI